MQQAILKPRRTRDGVVDVLKGLIARGDIADGARLEEIRLSEKMGVSRTPLREALVALEAEGWVSATPNKGVRVVAADETMVAELYPILAALESEALMLGGDALVASAGELRRINGKLAAEPRPERQHELDAAFHRALVGKCGNGRLLRLIESHWSLAGRFDGAGARGTADQRGSCDDHERIVEAIAAGDLRLGAQLLREHWHDGIAVVTAWLRG